ncbi:MAG TPA: ATP-binding cassette domain-containing protein [Lacunisphaera sp.]|nr:ATP-binding cassette domain-containing protein [Lacunisphaera sp.]
MSLFLQGIRLPLAHFTLEFEAACSGPVTALFGPSGSGKTTILETIAGLRQPTAGRITLDGTVLLDKATGVSLKPQQRAIGYVPQEGALFPHLSVRENLLYGHARQGAPHPALTFAHVTEVLEIGALADRRIESLSGGEKQRVALGRALLRAPRLLLLDEPLAGLDLALKERLLPHLRRVRDEFAIPMIYVTHSPDEAVALSQETIVLERGLIRSHGPTAELFTASPSQRYDLRPPPR